MEMKHLKISRLMDEYQDNEFFPEEGDIADAQAVRERVLAHANPASQKRHGPKRKKLFLAAALAAVMVMLMGAGLPYFQYHLLGGTMTFEKTADGKTISFSYSSEIVKCEDGRLIFTQADGQCVDITDLVSEETPYLYNSIDPDEGTITYVIIGGTPECFGWFYWIQTPYPLDDGLAVNFDENGNPVKTMYSFHLINYLEDFQRGCAGGDTVFLKEYMKRPWLLAGIEQLGIATENPPDEKDVIVVGRDK